MSRWWDRLAGIPIDAIGPGLLALLLVAAAALTAAAWQTYPRWVPRRAWWDALRRRWTALLGWRLPRWRWPGRRRPAAAEAGPAAADLAGDTLPDRTVAAFTFLADDLAAQGRYAEAVRERLRGMVRELVDAGVITHHPEWTVTELARAAVTARPVTGPPLDGASRTFSDIWYGQRDALPEHDAVMRRYAAAVHASLTPARAR